MTEVDTQRLLSPIQKEMIQHLWVSLFSRICKKELTGVPSKFALSGKNSARTGRTQLRFLIIGFTREAIRLRICSALSALCLSLRCENVRTKISDIGGSRI